MSHVITIDLHIKDLQSLQKAAEACGLELMRDQTRYKWYGRHVGDYPLPQGFNAADLGCCEHALVIPGNQEAYSVGVVKRRDGKPGYTLLWDFFAGGYGLEKAIGIDGVKLRDQYAAQVAVKAMRAKGFAAQIKTTATGLKVICTR